MIGWATAGVAVIVLGIVVGSLPVAFIGGAILLIRVVVERWPRRVLVSLAYERAATPRKTVVGDPVEVRLTLWNRSRLPIAWAVANDMLSEHLALVAGGQSGGPTPLSGRVDGASLGSPLRPFERVTRRLRVVPTRRGVHYVGPVRLSVAEHFGTQQPRLDVPDERISIIARPLTAPVVGATPQSAPLAQVRARTSIYTDPALFAGVRPFQTGDPLRAVHWRASARAATLQTKRYEPALARQQVIVVDVQTLEGPYWVLEFDENLFEDLCVTAMSLSRQLIAEDAACGLAAAGFAGTTHRYAYLPPRADRAQIGRIGDVLARLSPESSAPLVTLLSWLPQRVARGTTLTILTGRRPVGHRAIVKRLEASGFPVHFVVLSGGPAVVAETRRAGLSAFAARVETTGRRPTAVMIDG